MELILKNARYIDSSTLESKNTNILVHEGINNSISFLEEMPKNSTDYKVIDCSGKIVTHSLACGHHHIYSSLSRGMGAPKKNPENFYEILEYIWWTLDKCLDLEMVEASALTTALACAKNGISFIVDHHASPNAISGSLNVIAQALEKVGLNHLLCYEITDRDGMAKAEAGLQETESYLQNHDGLVGLHASFTVGNESLKNSVALAKKYNSGIHVHVAEDLYDQNHCEETYGKRIVERLNEAGALNFDKTILGHCLHLSENERNIIAGSKAWVVQNVESNLNNKVGFFNAKGFEEKVLLGTDGMHSDMIRSAQAAFLVGRNFDVIGYDTAYSRFRNTHNYLKKNAIAGDSENNLIVMDYKSPTELNPSNFYGHFVHGFQSDDISHLIVNGKLVMENKIVLTINEEEVLKKSHKVARELWKKMQA